MPYFAPVFAFGKVGVRSVTAGMPPGAGATVLFFDNGDDAFAVGDLVFLSEGDGTGNEFLGAVKSVAPDRLSVTVEIPVHRAKEAGALVWKPASWVRFSIGPGWNVSRRFVPGVRTRISRGGRIFTTQTADPYHALAFDFPKRAASDFEALENWLIAQRHDGRDPFAVAFWDPVAGCPRVCEAVMELGSGTAEEDGGGGPAGLSATAEYENRATFGFQVYATALDGYRVT